MSDKVTELKQQPKISPEQQRGSDLQAKVDIAAKVFHAKVRAAHTDAQGVVTVDFLKMYSGQLLFEKQFNAIVNTLIEFGMPADKLLEAMLKGIETGTAELVRQMIMQPQNLAPDIAPSRIQAP